MNLNKGQQNTAFVGDDGQRVFVEKDAKTDGQYVLELTEKRPAKDQDYEPYSHRKVEHPTTNTDTLIHLLKGSLGTGILAMPMAFKHSGYIVGSVGTILIGLLCTYCIHILIKAEYELCRRKKIPSLTYPAVAEAALQEGPGWCKTCAPYIM